MMSPTAYMYGKSFCVELKVFLWGVTDEEQKLLSERDFVLQADPVWTENMTAVGQAQIKRNIMTGWV